MYESEASAPLRIAALRGLLAAEPTRAVPLAIGAMGGDDESLAAVAAGLIREVPGEAVTKALAAELPTLPPAGQVTVLSVLADRGGRSAGAAVLRATGSKDASVRLAALSALGVLGGQREGPMLVRLLASARTDADRAAAGKAIVSVARRLKDPSELTGLVLAALERTAAPTQVAVLGLLPDMPTEAALATVRAYVVRPDGRVHDAAVRALAAWPNADALAGLMKLAAARDSTTDKVLALRGVARLLALPGDQPAAETVALYARALEAADRPEEKRLLLAGLGAVAHADALKLVEPLLADKSVAAEAGAAAARIADAIAMRNRHAGVIRAWRLSGPYAVKGKAGPQLHDVAFAPERPAGNGAKWRRVAAGPDGVVDLARQLGGEDRAAYLCATLHSPRRQPARLLVGSDDGVKVWLDAKRVHDRNVSRAITPGEDKITVTLRKGANVLLVKVFNAGGPWAASVRVIGADGQAVPGLKVTAE